MGQPSRFGPYQKLYFHNPDCANDYLYYPRVKQFNKRSGVSLIGSVHSVYPLRVEAQKAIRLGLINDGVVRNHPGYDFSLEANPENYNPKSPTVARHRQQQEDYAT